MDVKNLADELKNKAGEVENLMRRKLPVIVGRMAKDHYQEVLITSYFLAFKASRYYRRVFVVVKGESQIRTYRV